MVSIAPLIIGAAQSASAGSAQTSRISLEFFGFDFISLGIKLGIYFLVAIVIDKIHFLITGTANIAATILLAFGINLPTKEPQFLTKLFSPEGFQGFKFWDVVKFGALALVIVEMVLYIQTQRNLGGSPSPFTLAIFVMIVAALSLYTIPDLIEKLKTRINTSTAGV